MSIFAMKIWQLWKPKLKSYKKHFCCCGFSLLFLFYQNGFVGRFSFNFKSPVSFEAKFLLSVFVFELQNPPKPRPIHAYDSFEPVPTREQLLLYYSSRSLELLVRESDRFGYRHETRRACHQTARRQIGQVQLIRRGFLECLTSFQRFLGL